MKELHPKYYTKHLKGKVKEHLDCGTFPKHWRNSAIILIEKKTNTKKCKKFRLVNLLPVYEKLPLQSIYIIYSLT